MVDLQIHVSCAPLETRVRIFVFFLFFILEIQQNVGSRVETWVIGVFRYYITISLHWAMTNFKWLIHPYNLATWKTKRVRILIFSLERLFYFFNIFLFSSDFCWEYKSSLEILLEYSFVIQKICLANFWWKTIFWEFFW